MHRFAARLAWLAAVIAMVTAVVAPALHTPLDHLLCGDCCVSTNPEADLAKSTCHQHAGHQHSHSHAGGHHHPANEAPPPANDFPLPDHHSSDDCSLCQVLSQSASTTPVLSLSLTVECVEVLSEYAPFAPLRMVIEKPFSRGPPVA